MYKEKLINLITSLENERLAKYFYYFICARLHLDPEEDPGADK